jgi:hypothetical protein
VTVSPFFNTIWSGVKPKRLAVISITLGLLAWARYPEPASSTNRLNAGAVKSLKYEFCMGVFPFCPRK